MKLEDQLRAMSLAINGEQPLASYWLAAFITGIMYGVRYDSQANRMLAILSRCWPSIKAEAGDRALAEIAAAVLSTEEFNVRD